MSKPPAQAHTSPNCASPYYLFRLEMTDTGGDGWSTTWAVKTDGTTRFSGTLASGSAGVDYFCLEDGSHEMVVDGTDHEIGWSIHDTHASHFYGTAPGV